MNKDVDFKNSVLKFSCDCEHKQEIKNKINYLTYHDSLTGLYNRRYIEEELIRLDKKNMLPISIVIGDINGLRFINNILGYRKGDSLLKSAAKIICGTCGSKCPAARWGGDEFIILLPNTSSESVKKICGLINNKYIKKSPEGIKSSISLGYDVKITSEQNVFSVLKNAEDAMFRYKYLETNSFRSSIISSIKKTLYEKNHETEEHEERLKLFCVAVGKAMNLSENELHELELSAALHDIGKIAINDSVLNKPGKLNDEEWCEMRKHPEIGCRIAQSVPELNEVSNYILSHHERFDGSGYPRGIKGNEIPVMSRIVAVADAFDAMISDRPYRSGMPKIDALNEIKRNEGTQFDPQIAEKFIDVVSRICI